jgi:uncharacterized protein (TIGR03790 family)
VAETNQIRFVALMRGVPLKIAATTNYPGDRPMGQPALATHNEAAVDSELALLGLGSHSISGIYNNPYFRSFTSIGDMPAPEMMLVCRLDAPTPDMVRKMIVDSIMAEKTGLQGIAYVDARGITDAGLVQGDEWLFALAANARKQGIPVVLDQGPGLFPDAYPMRHAAYYFGWYSENVCGPFTRPDFHFEPGAIAVHIHSFSANTLRDAHLNWCAPLLAAGAAATVGNVYEPYLDLTPHLDIFFDRLRAGFTFAESAYMSERVLSWMTTFVGDPLYRPFVNMLPTHKPPMPNEWETYRIDAQKWFADRRAAEDALREDAARMHSGVIAEGLGLLELTVSDLQGALAAFNTARNLYRDADDSLRVCIHEIGVLNGLKRHTDALTLAAQQIGAHPNCPGNEVLKMLLPEIASAPVSPSTTPPPQGK